MRPRPVTEFFAKFTPPKTQGKLTSRLKCNIYYYRANYFFFLIFSFVVAFFRNPWALLATAMACFSLLRLMAMRSARVLVTSAVTIS